MTDQKYRKVSDHCDYTGEYRGTAHSIYNVIIMYLKNSFSFS